MAREVPPGTPTRATRYLVPAGRRLTLFSAVAAMLLAVLVFGIYQAGRWYAPARAVLSPGVLAGAHAPLDSECSLCHRPVAGVANMRCERCHDPAVQQRVTHAAHVMLGSGDPMRAAAVEEPRCAQCHTEHVGREGGLARVDDRECAACHGFASMRRHPEFAAVRAGATSGRGLTFNHVLHLERVRRERAGADACGRCHEATSDGAGFLPIAFDRSCASCHVENGVLARSTIEGVAGDAIVRPAAMEEPLPQAEWPSFDSGPRGTVIVGGLRHRDRWVTYNALRLRRVIDPDGEAAERAALRAQEAWLSRQLEVQQAPLTAAVVNDEEGRAFLERWASELDAEIAGLDANLSAKPFRPGDERSTVDRMAEGIAALQDLVAARDPSLVEDARASAQIDPPLEERHVPGEFARRRSELLQALDAIERRGGDNVAARSADLRRRIEALAPSSGEGADTAALERALASLDEVVRVLARMADPAARYESSQLAGLRAAARVRLGGLSPDEVDARRREMLAALDAVERAGGVAYRSRIGELRRRVLALAPGGPAGDPARARTHAVRLRDRIRLELELGPAARRFAPAAVAAGSDGDVQARLDAARARLARLEAGPRPAMALDETAQARAQQELEMLLMPCTTCHTMTGARLDPVIVAQPSLERSLFTHRPHVTQTGCATCHDMVEGSRQAADPNIAGVATCRTCHDAGKAPARCATCHVYHPKSLAHVMPAL